MFKTTLVLVIEHSKPIPELTDIAAGRIYTLDGVEDVTAEMQPEPAITEQPVPVVASDSHVRAVLLSYHSNNLTEDEAVRLLATPQAEPAPVVVSEPMFWVRLCGDGLYEGPHHHKSAEGKMLRGEKPGQWHPLFLATPQAGPKNELWIDDALHSAAATAQVLASQSTPEAA